MGGGVISTPSSNNSQSRNKMSGRGRSRAAFRKEGMRGCSDNNLSSFSRALLGLFPSTGSPPTVAAGTLEKLEFLSALLHQPPVILD